MKGKLKLLNRILGRFGFRLHRNIPSIEEIHSAYFTQRVRVSKEFLGSSRMQVIPRICDGKKVLHIGCLDWPITNVEQNLHLRIDSVVTDLVGVDTAIHAFEMLRPRLKHERLYGDLEKIRNEHFDLLLVPEVLEHVGNVAEFLGELDTLNFEKAVITVPDAYLCGERHFHFDESDQTFIEAVHPDHNCWYTPYTIKSTITKYTGWVVDELYFLDMSLMAICSKHQVEDG